MGKQRIKLFILLSVIFLVSTLFAQVSLAYRIDSVLIEDRVAEDLTTFEVMDVSITNNTDESMLWRLPPNVYEVDLNGNPIDVHENAVNISLHCTVCGFQLSYAQNNVVKDFSVDSLMFYRTLDLPQPPELLHYTVKISPLYIINKKIDVDGELPIVPIPTETKVTVSGPLVQWVETEPALPKVYQITFKSHEDIENAHQEFIDEFSEGTMWIIIITAVLFGLLLGIAICSFIHKKKKKGMYVPSSLLSPDEKTVLRLLKEHKNMMNQKEIGIQLQWSKSKVSAIVSNLHYKEIIKKEKFGRNYKIYVIKEIEPL